MKKALLSLALSVLMVLNITAQTRTLTGTVVSSDVEEPLIGATVVLQGTTHGVVTNLDGRFEIPYDGDAENLLITYVGYLDVVVPITTSNVYTVTLELSTVGLDEVVVTALGVTREKKTLGFAVQDVDGAELNQTKDNNIVNSLSGKIAGVQVTSGGSTVGSSSRIVIRGNASFSGNEPLFVIDGTPLDNSTTDLGGAGGVDYGNAAADIDPNTVESVTVLKGANATALYGSRATNGVILITTKRGNEGRKLGVDFNSSVVIDKPSYFPNLQNEYGAGQQGSEYYYDQYQSNNPSSSLSYNEYAKQFSYNWVDGMGGGVNDGGELSWGPRLDAGLNLDQWSTGKDSPWVSRPDNYKMDYFNTGVNIENNLSVSASGEKAYGRLSFTNRNSTGIIDNTDQSQNTVNASVTVTPTDRITATANVTYLSKNSDNIYNNGYSGPMVEFAWGTRDLDIAYMKQQFEEEGNSGYGFRGSNDDNWFYDLRNTNSLQRDRAFGNAGIEYQITDWLSLNARAGIDFYNEYRKEITQSGTSRNIKKGYGGQFYQTQLYNREFNGDLFLNFDKSFGEFRLDGLLGANYRNHEYKTVYMGASDLTVPDLYTISNVSGSPTVNMYDYEKETNSVFAAANLSYGDFLFLGVTGRNDWSSTLPADNWSYFYPSVSLGFSVLDAFEIESELVSYAKLRTSWAKVGGDTSPYQLSRTYSASSYNSISMFTPTSTLPPVNLLPEETRSYEIGADVRLWNNRIGLDITYYNQNTVNQILSVSTSSTTGYTAMLLNAGEISNNGVEIMLNARALSSANGLTWDIDVNWAKNRSTVVELYGDLESYVMGKFGGCKTIAKPGEDWGVLWGLPFPKDENGRVIVNDNGIPTTTGDAVNLGSIVPDWTGGLRNTFRYKGASLSFLIDARMGGDFFSTSAWHSYFTGAYTVTTDNNVRETGMIVDGVHADGSENTTRVAAQEYFAGSWMWNNHEYSIIDGSYVKLRELVIGYDFNVSSIDWLYKLNLSFVGRNLAILYRSEGAKLYGLDPEVGLGGGESGMGFENFQIPTTRSFGVKLSVSF